MKIEINSLNPGPNHFEAVLTRKDFRPEIVDCEVRGTLKLVIDSHEDTFFITGQMKAAVELECSRCLSPIEEEVDIRFTCTARETKAEDEEDVDLNVIPYVPGDKELDLSPVISEELAVALPMAPVCDPECKGLCPICKADLNEKQCGCKRTEANPVWEPLLKLKRSS